MIQCGDPVSFVVPTGNFGDILAGYLAKRIGLPVNKLICASNTNNVLTDFINTGTYSMHREPVPYHHVAFHGHPDLFQSGTSIVPGF